MLGQKDWPLVEQIGEYSLCRHVSVPLETDSSRGAIVVCGASRIDAAASCRCMFGGSLGSIPRVRCGPTMGRRAVLFPGEASMAPRTPVPFRKVRLCTFEPDSAPPQSSRHPGNNIRCRVWSVHVVLHNVSGIGGSKDTVALLFSRLSSFSSSCRDSCQAAGVQNHICNPPPYFR